MKRIYLVKGRLIRAVSNEQAMCYVAGEEFKAVIPTQDELLTLVQQGVKVENARPEQMQVEVKV